MKLFSLIALSIAFACSLAQAGSSVEGDRTITQVVKLLQEMLDKSKTEGDTERDLFAKYKCYCDTSEEEKKAEIERLSEEIALLESQIEELQASSAKLSKEVEKLKADMDANQAEQAEATAIRQKQNTEFLALRADLEGAIDQMDRAIQTLADVGGDQTLQSAADHKQYMAGEDAGATLLKLRSTVKSALLAAGSFVSKQQAKSVESFLQAPFTGTYTSQSGEVVGILKDMRDTFRANKKAAEEEEARQLAAYDKYMEELRRAFAEMETSYYKKQGELGSNDGSLSAKRSQLQTASESKAEAEDFLGKLLDMCAAKKKQYDERVALRTNEQSALAEAISILNSDAAFATFGTVDATKTGNTGATLFTQMRRSAVRKHLAAAISAGATEGEPRRRAQAFLQKAADLAEQGSSESSALVRIAELIRANNPFKVVLEEIEKMISLLAAEGDKDKKQKDWCDEERRITNDGIVAKKAQITSLNSDIGVLDNEINDPETGLKATIKVHEDTLQRNYESQVTETKERKEENIAYQQDISNLVEAETLVERAIVVLRKYYSKISDEIKAEMSLVQSRKRDDPAPPSTWEDKYTGQSEAGGTDAISMLEFILKNTKAEEAQAHEDEKSGQHSYEDSMQALKDEEALTQTELAKTRKTLTEKEEELMQKRSDLKKTEAEKKALEDYLVEIKPGCDFITENLDLRDTNRLNEKTALENAVQLIQGTPAYQEAMAAAHTESLGDCKDICAVDEDFVECKACLAHTSIPGYCAGHPTTSGCK